MAAAGAFFVISKLFIKQVRSCLAAQGAKRCSSGGFRRISCRTDGIFLAHVEASSFLEDNEDRTKRALLSIIYIIAGSVNRRLAPYSFGGYPVKVDSYL